MFGELFFVFTSILSVIITVATHMLLSLGIIAEPTIPPTPAPSFVQEQSFPIEESSPSNITEALSKTITKITPVIEAVMEKVPKTTPPLPSADTSTSATTTNPSGSTPLLSTEDLNRSARSSVVNIICITTQGGMFRPLSGSGMIIDPRGVIITNAHIAEYFLLEKYRGGSLINCKIRTGGPAHDTYDAEPIFISSSWIDNNINTIADEKPVGTGEYDIALLRITKSITDTPLPSTFPFMLLAENDTTISSGTNVIVASYPAELIGGISIQENLWPVTAISEVVEMFTFSSGTSDIFSLKGSIASQHGSSGGGTISTTTGRILGIIATSTDGETTADRELNAITPEHINQTFIKDTGKTLVSFLSEDPKILESSFAQHTAPDFLKRIISVLEK